MQIAAAALPPGYRSDLDALGGTLHPGDAILSAVSLFGREETALLVAYLGVDPYVSKRAMEKQRRRAEVDARLREIRQQPMKYRGGPLL